MMRLFALVMICVLTMSHGTMGMAAPHAAKVVHSPGHSYQHDGVASADGAAEPADGDTDESPPVDQDIAHVHSAGDMLPALGDIPAQHFACLVHMGPPSSGPLGSTDPAPLLEPPSA